MTAGDPVAQALAFILDSTQARPQTQAEVAERLSKRGVAAEAAAAAIARAQSIGAVNDPVFAKVWVEDRGRTRGYSGTRLRAELRRRKVPEELIEDALALLEDRDDLAVATELARQRAGRLPSSLTPEAIARRLSGFLERRGYAAGLARRVAIDVSGLGRAWD